jgi:hypothetical protein
MNPLFFNISEIKIVVVLLSLDFVLNFPYDFLEFDNLGGDLVDLVVCVDQNLAVID